MCRSNRIKVHTFFLHNFVTFSEHFGHLRNSSNISKQYLHFPTISEHFPTYSRRKVCSLIPFYRFINFRTCSDFTPSRCAITHSFYRHIGARGGRSSARARAATSAPPIHPIDRTVLRGWACPDHPGCSKVMKSHDFWWLWRVSSS